MKLESTVPYLGIEVDNALSISVQVELYALAGGAALMQLGPQSLSRRIRYLLEKKSLSPPPGRSVMPHSCHLGFNCEASPSRARRKPVIRFFVTM